MLRAAHTQAGGVDEDVGGVLLRMDVMLIE
jgi:hypothetical protein